MNLRFLIPAFLLSLAFFPGCQPPEEDLASEADFEKWYPQYNRYVRDWLGKQVEEIGAGLKKLEEEIATEEDADEKKRLADEKLEKLFKDIDVDGSGEVECDGKDLLCRSGKVQ